MVLSALRDKIKIIILVTLAAFVGLIFFQWGMQATRSSGPKNPGVLGTVNGQKITDSVYRRTRQSVLNDFEARTGRPAEASDLDALEDDVWLTIVQEMLLQEQIRKYGIAVSDAEILELLRTNPPDFVRGVPDFQDEEGKFDPVRYTQALSNPAYENLWLQVEGLIRATAPTDKVRNYVGLGARVTTGEVRRRFLDGNEKVRVRYVASTTGSVELDDAGIPDEELRGWYEAHPDDFRAGRQAVLEYVRVSKAPSPADSAAAREDLEDIRKGILEGADFAKEATDWSDDTSAERGGDLGFFGRGDMVPEFEEVAFALDPGQVSEVFSTTFGYHIVKVEARRTEDGEEQVHARHILLRPEASRGTLRVASNRMDDFLFELDSTEFDAAAKATGLEVETTPPFERGDFIPGIGLLRPAHRFAFTAGVGATSTAPVEDEQYLYAFRLKEVRDAGLEPFEAVQDRVRISVAEEKRRQAAKAALEQAVAGADGTLGSIADALGVDADTTSDFTREDFVPGVGRRNAFVATAFELPDGRVSGVIESDRGFYVMEVVARTPADEADLLEQRDQIRGQLMLEKRQSIILGWMERLMMDADIRDFRGGAEAEWKPDPATFLYLRNA